MARSRFDWVSVGIVAVPLAALYVLARAGAFKPKAKDVPDRDATPAPAGAVDPAGFAGTQDASDHPLGTPRTPSAELGPNPAPLPASSDGSGLTTFGDQAPPPYQPGYGFYDETWQRDYAAPHGPNYTLLV